MKNPTIVFLAIILILKTSVSVGQPCWDFHSTLGIPGFVGGCYDNDTPCDDTDDYYIVEYAAIDDTPNPSNSYNLVVSGTAFGPFNYSTSTIPYTYYNLGRFPADGGNLTFTTTDVDDPTCTFTWTNPVPSDPCSNITTGSLNYICNDNGTPLDPSDDFFDVSINVTDGTGTYEVKDGVNTYGPFPYDVTNTFRVGADGLVHTLQITNVADPRCNLEEIIGPLEPCSEECDINIDDVTWICNDNGTPDPTDDFYTITITASETYSRSGYIVNLAGGQFGPYSFNVPNSFVFRADGGTYSLRVGDSQYPDDCFDEFPIGPLVSCSPPCNLETELIDVTCVHNETADPTDDFYEITFKVTASNSGMSTSYIVDVDGTNYGPYLYGSTQVITIDADGKSHLLEVFDELFPSFCKDEVSTPVLDPCSSTCDLTVEVINIQCDDNKTGKDSTDDFFTFDIVVDASNAGDYWRAYEVDTVLGDYGDTVTMGPFLILGGGVIINVEDTLDVFCRQSINISAPPSCSDSCWITDATFIIDSCYDNGTGQDTTDDVFYITLNVQGANIGLNKTYMIDWVGGVLGPFAYDVPQVISGLPSDGNNVLLTITDSDLLYCEYEINLSNPHCSSCNQTVEAGPDKLITCVNKEVALEGGASESGQYEWSGPNNSTFTGPNPLVNTGGWYIMTVSFDNGCQIKDSVWVEEDNMIPVADAGPDGVLTCKDEDFTLMGTSPSSASNIVFEWRDGNGSVISNMQNHIVNVPGIYCLVVVDTVQNCVSSEDCVEVTENKTPPDAFIFVGPQSSINCFVDSVNLYTLGEPNVIYKWELKSSQITSPSIWVKDTGNIILIAIDTTNGCISISDTTIESKIEYPLVDIMEPDTLTCITKDVLLDASTSQTGGQLKYQWYDQTFTAIPGAINLTWLVSTPGTYYFASLDSIIGCENIDTVVVEERYLYPNVSAMSSQLLSCFSDSVRLSANANLNGTMVNWVGQNGGSVLQDGNTLEPLVFGEGLYIIEVQDLKSGCISRDSVIVESPMSPEELMLTASDPLCFGDSTGTIKLDQVIGGTPPYDLYFDGILSTTTEWSSLSPGVYHIEARDINGCDIDTTIEIISSTELTLSINGVTQIKAGQSVVLTGIPNINPGDIQTIYWQSTGQVPCSDCIEITVSPDSTTTYFLEIIDKNGCVALAEITVLVEKESNIFIPNTISPNGDGLNDFLKVFGEDVVWIHQLSIFDRWGEEIFKGEGEPDLLVWDGTFRGNALQPDVFVYYVVLETKLGVVQRLSGSVTIVR